MNQQDVTQTNYFKIIKGVVDKLHASGMTQAGSGYCLSMSDIVLKLLHKEGIKAKIIECNLMVTLKNPPGLYLMGYPGFNPNNYDSEKMMQTHVICVTETEVPILIDLSIAHIDKNIPYICAPILKSHEHTNLSEYDFQTSTWIYTQREDTNMELPKLHQKSILDRIKTDQKVDKEINYIKTLLLILFAVSSTNFIRGSYDFYQKYVNKTNGFGPNSVEYIKNK